MSTKTGSLEEIKNLLTYLWQGAASKRKFPKELWDSCIIHFLARALARLTLFLSHLNQHRYYTNQ